MSFSTNHRKNELKTLCKESSIESLEKLLVEKHKQLIKMNTTLTHGKSRFAYGHDELKGKKISPIKDIRKDIAVIKTFLNQKTKQQT